MTDKILTEAYAKLTQIEEDDGGSDYYNEKRQRKHDNETRTSGSDYYSEKRQQRKDNSRNEKPIEEEDGVNDDILDGIEEFTEIQDELFNVIERLDSAIRAYAPDKHRYWQAYGLAHLKVIAGSDEYASSDESITTLIKRLQDELENDRDQHGNRPERGR